MNGYNNYNSNLDFAFDHCFAYPNTTIQAQATENFWQQTPEVSNFTYTYYDSITGPFFHFDPAFSTDNMNTKVVKIGSATNHSSKRTAAPVKEYVDVYVSDQLVKTVPLRQLTRFSKAASRAFPAPSPAEQVAKVGEEKVKKAEGKTADVEEKAANVEGKTETAEGKIESETDDPEGHADVKALTEGVEDLTTPEKPADSAAKAEKPATPPGTTNGKKEISPEAKQKSASPSSKKNDKLTAVAESQQEPNKIFRVELDGVPNYPTAKAIVQSLTWMEMNQAMHNNMRLLPFYVPDESEGYPFAAYIDIYAAALAFDLRPFPVNLRNTIFNLITAYRPFFADVARIVERVPLDDSIVKRMITSCYEHESEYEGSEWADLVEYSMTNQPLNQRFIDVEKVRRRFQSKQSRQQMQAESMLRQQQGWGVREAAEGRGMGNGSHSKDHSRGDSSHTRQLSYYSAPSTVPITPKGRSKGQGGKTDGDKKATCGVKANDDGKANGGGMANGGGKQKEGNGKGVGGKHVPGA
ncbi:hypothetical protein LTR35_001766 [Friedmanniomyces endolithicus]|uniref:Uncharacterized protein n=1 Tax=Friedmanniomyces endolithicus TaxID=329885 RepID=A0AAN6FXU5_9PEZI|nr:hypothetical protein LTR35_001766 [Friedmanniomyces endolithicus]KAK0296852.1 hypothetical protein LTS00_004652 [Friedmanniomyces endolithicus]KAK0325428.1 hypothetical protein LTR82_003711 [Friedmanniomyces endolithicus]KAK1011151.1 hypothetical protein LTR54_005069 [Friedmanniomyces endolithicus]